MFLSTKIEGEKVEFLERVKISIIFGYAQGRMNEILKITLVRLRLRVRTCGQEY